MADKPTVDEILGERKDPPISLEDIEKATAKSKGALKDPSLKKIFKSSIEVLQIQDKALNRNNNDNKEKQTDPLRVDTIHTTKAPSREEENKDDIEQGE